MDDRNFAVGSSAGYVLGIFCAFVTDVIHFCSHKKKRAKQVKKLMQRGLLDPEKVDPFSLFIESGGITYCQYRDSERVLGNTFGMCILQVAQFSHWLGRTSFCCILWISQLEIFMAV